VAAATGQREAVSDLCTDLPVILLPSREPLIELELQGGRWSTHTSGASKRSWHNWPRRPGSNPQVTVLPRCCGAESARRGGSIQLHPLPRALRALAHEPVVTENGPHPPVEAEPTAPRRATVILAGRATSVPFTAVLAGVERTTTDNYEAASTCAVPRPRR
jgi:hypothetical protein